jgi:hypothetical protein
MDLSVVGDMCCWPKRGVLAPQFAQQAMVASLAGCTPARHVAVRPACGTCTLTQFGRTGLRLHLQGSWDRLHCKSEQYSWERLSSLHIHESVICQHHMQAGSHIAQPLAVAIVQAFLC